MTQSRIIQLPLLVANQIAAGEVVERPASVVKELLENSIDANASKIEVEVEGGGLHLIRVRDNGIGIIKEDLILAFSRHATSKIATPQDLEAITSMGFRGEALASIASVSRCRLVSQVEKQSSAWQIQWTDNLTPLIQPAAHPIGTTVEVIDLFYNTPVRRKFLRSERTEFQAIEEVIRRFALAFPFVSITLKHQQKLVRHFPKANSLMCLARLTKVCGQQFATNAIEISLEAGAFSLQGWLGLPNIARRQADCQYFFVNQRMIKDKVLNHVIKSIYHTHEKMIEGSYPCYVLYLTVDPKEVDVNVHPTKQEVRFSQARLVHDFMSKGVHEALLETKKEEKIITAPFQAEKKFKVQEEKIQEIDETSEVLAKSSKEKPICGKRYAVIEDDNGIMIIDLRDLRLLIFYFEQHAPHIPTKKLLFPLRFKIKHPVTQNIIVKLNHIGFHLRMENNEIIVLQQPVILAHMNTMMIENLLNAARLEDEMLWQAMAQLPRQTGAFDPVFLTAWAEKNPQRVLRLSHEMIDEMRGQLSRIRGIAKEKFKTHEIMKLTRE